MHSPVELIAIVGRHAFEAGREYARADRARVLAHDPDDGVVFGSCRGSGGRVYNLVVRYETSRYGVIDDVVGQCSCPVSENCKHCVALLLTALASARTDAAPRAGATPRWQTTLDDVFPPPQRDALPLALALELTPPRLPDDGEARPERYGR